MNGRPTILIAMTALVLVAACSAGRGSSPAAATPLAGAASSAPTAADTSPTPTVPATLRPASPSASTSPANTRYTPDDKRIATLIKAGVATAVPQLHELHRTELSKLVAFFEPVGTWIAKQKAALAGLTPSSCTAPAVSLFTDGLKQYESMRKKFMAWKDWGAHRDPFAPGAPMVAIRTMQDAVTELDAHCPR